MGFNKRKMEDRRRKAAEQEAAAREAKATLDKSGIFERPIVTEITLTTKEFLAGGEDFKATLPKTPVDAERNGGIIPRCVFCPDAEYPEEARKLGTKGTVEMIITVEADGTTNDLFIVGPQGHGLDGSAIDAVLKWKFDPALDALGNKAATHFTVEVSFKTK